MTLAQQHVNLKGSPMTQGDGGIAGGALTWRFQASPSPISRMYDLRLMYRLNGVPAAFVDHPDLTSLAKGVRIPHLYSEQPARLCLYLPSAYEWRSSMLLDRTIVPWAVLWLWYFEDWLATGEWRGGGVHVSPEVEAEIVATSPGLGEVSQSGKEAA
ncbi:hypothetical protein [Methylobacterium brachythecii]|uniref:hypothetical protein n=1 Tax=Methylobacterium brachythecii TaxID=1176177 RepID=UPI001613FA32|nr:hypothetical protein [Methylobacterium brachythecii]